jgi:hypothetical protein
MQHRAFGIQGLQPTHLFLATSKWISKLLEQFGKPLMDRQQSEGSGHLRTDSKVLTAHSQRPLPRKIRLGQTPAQGNTKRTHEDDDEEGKRNPGNRKRRRTCATPPFGLSFFGESSWNTFVAFYSPNMCLLFLFAPVFLWEIFLNHISGFLLYFTILSSSHKG